MSAQRALCAYHRCLTYSPLGRGLKHPETRTEKHMAKGQMHNNKMAKKPKKDTSPPREGSGSDRPMPPVTSVIPRGKDKNK
jgi:hypothetical protein